METRLIVAYALIALMVLALGAFVAVAIRRRDKHRRRMRR